MDNKNIIEKLLLILLIIGIFPYVYLSGFTHPIGDDYCYSNLGLKPDYLSTVLNEYFIWNGRYASNFLVIANPMVWDNLSFYQTMPFILILGTIIGFYVLYDSFVEKLKSGLFKINLSLASTLLFFFQMPSTAEGFYWYTGAVSYQAANILFLIQLALIINYFKNKFLLHKYFHFFITACLLIIMIGFNEIMMVTLLLFHLYLAFKHFQIQRKLSPSLLILVIISIIGATVVILAPGNSVRAANYPESHNLIRSLGFTGLQMFRFFFDWVSNAPFILGTIILIPITRKLSERIYLFKDSFFLSPAESSLILFAILFICIFPPYWTTNILGQHRTINAAYFLFILAWLVNIVVWTNYYYLRGYFSFNLSKNQQSFLVAIIVFSLIITKNGYEAFYDIFYKKASAFNSEMEERYNQIKTAKSDNKTILELIPTHSKPQTLFILDLTNDEKHWINRCQGKYNGIDIYVK